MATRSERGAPVAPARRAWPKLPLLLYFGGRTSIVGSQQTSVVGVCSQVLLTAIDALKPLSLILVLIKSTKNKPGFVDSCSFVFHESRISRPSWLTQWIRDVEFLLVSSSVSGATAARGKGHVNLTVAQPDAAYISAIVTAQEKRLQAWRKPSNEVIYVT